MLTNNLALVFTLTMVAGCTGLSNKVDDGVAKDGSKASQLVKDVGHIPAGSAASTDLTILHEPGIWIGVNSVKAKEPPLPSVFHEPAIFDRTVTSLSEFAERITMRSGILTTVSPDALIASTAAMQTANNNAAGTTQPGATGVRPLPSGLPGTEHSGRSVPPVRLIYTSGTFKGLLDMASARFGVNWKYVNGQIQFHHTDSRTFQIAAIPGDSTFTATVTSGATSTGGATGGAGAGTGTGASANGVTAVNSQNTAVASQLSVYSSLEKSISAMLSTYGKVVTSPATGSITVVDTPDKLDRIAAFIEKENKTLSRQVVINVTVLSVNLSDADEYGINWDLVYSTLRRKYGLSNTVAANPNSTAFSAGILAASTNRWAGSSLVINALSEQGKVRRHTTASVVTLNNQPVPVQVAKQTSYLQSLQASTVALVGTTTSLTPGTVTSGFNMSILPHILNNGMVMLQFSTDISTLRGIRTVSSNGSSIETPEMDTRNFLQRVSMKSNETLIISGFEQTDENLDNRGVGVPKNILFGGGYKAQSNKEVIVILITPVTMGGS